MFKYLFLMKSSKCKKKIDTKMKNNLLNEKGKENDKNITNNNNSNKKNKSIEKSGIIDKKDVISISNKRKIVNKLPKLKLNIPSDKISKSVEPSVNDNFHYQSLMRKSNRVSKPKKQFEFNYDVEGKKLKSKNQKTIRKNTSISPNKSPNRIMTINQKSTLKKSEKDKNKDIDKSKFSYLDKDYKIKENSTNQIQNLFSLIVADTSRFVFKKESNLNFYKSDNKNDLGKSTGDSFINTNLNHNNELKKKKVPVLPQNQSVVKSYVKYLKYYNVSAKTFGIKVTKTEKTLDHDVVDSIDDEDESKNKAEDHSINNAKSEITFSNFIDRSGHKTNNNFNSTNKEDAEQESINVKNNEKGNLNNNISIKDEKNISNAKMNDKDCNDLTEIHKAKGQQVNMPVKEKVVFFNPFNNNNSSNMTNNNNIFNENEIMTYNHTFCTFKTQNTANSNLTFNTIHSKESPKTDNTPNTAKTFNNTLYTRSSLSLSRNTHSYMSDAQLIDSIVKDNVSKDKKASIEKNKNNDKIEEKLNKEKIDIKEKKESSKNKKKDEVTYFNVEKNDIIDQTEFKKSASRPITKKQNKGKHFINFQ